MKYMEEDMDTTRKDKVPANNVDRTEQIESSYQYLKKQVSNIQDKLLRQLCEYFIEDDLWKNTRGSSTGHHSYQGGLIVHTAEVMEIALQMAESSVLQANKDYIITAVLWHDIGKEHDYYADGQKTAHYSLIRHLSKSYAQFYMFATQRGVDDKAIEAIGHIILSHHGRKEWGSPIEPETTEAYIVHYADMLSSICAKDFYIRNNNDKTCNIENNIQPVFVAGTLEPITHIVSPRPKYYGDYIADGWK